MNSRETSSDSQLLLYSQDFAPIENFQGQHILSAKQFTPENLNVISQKASEIEEMLHSSAGKRQLRQSLEDYVGVVLFYEPSTRTRSSFEVAIARTGARTFTESDAEMSSRFKGEPLGHTFRVLTGPGGADFVVIRDPEEGFYDDVLPYAELTHAPVINGGDGSREHPFQSAKDYYSLMKDFGHIDGLTITFLGDVKFSRVVHSNAFILSQFDVDINLVSPPEVRTPREVVELLKRGKARVREFSSLQEMEREGVEAGDAMYVTRLQIERAEKELIDTGVGEELILKTASDLREAYDDARVTESWVQAHPHTRIYHPMPIERVRKVEKKAFPVPGEIARGVDFMPQARYFQQSDNGIPVAAALISLVLKGN